ncbi:MAG TPA: DUF3090 domain-containing protein [Actinomycetales bacterium]|jgi:uncharacterized repeat protein (TIGR03847 family)|nr:DUF3090 domain-containing protein [Actinomycetales bacterium]
MPVFDYDPPERFVAGTVGEPGDRTFFLQAVAGARVTSVALEKQQVQVLAERVDELLDEVLRRTGGQAPVPAMAPADLEDVAPLASPVEEDFRVGTMTLVWDGDAQRVVIECLEVGQEATPEGDLEPSPDASLLRVRLTGAAARAFAKRAGAVVAAGRPPCPFCGNPLDRQGHVCPRANGHRR